MTNNKQNSYIAYQLREMTRFGRVASVYCDSENPDYYIAGFVLASNAKTTLIRSVSPYGRYDGFFGIRLTEIDEVDLDMHYADKLELLLRLNDQKETEIPISDSDDHIQMLLQKAMEENRCVTVWSSKETYSGFVDSVNDLHVTMRVLDLMGIPYDPMQFRLTEIDIVSVGSEEEQTYEQLNQYQNTVKEWKQD